VAAGLDDATVAGMGGDDPEMQERWLADVSETRSRGYAIDVDGLEAGLTSVAVLVPADLSGIAAGMAVGMAGPSARLTPKRAARLIPRLRDAAASLAILIE
jgi:DNA-binding IclR family transcriptional regulator